MALNSTAGYWEPHTSSIDFCEENYRFTPLVAELLNTVSSLPIVVIGLACWSLSPPRYRTWPRFLICWISFLVVGVGSMAFHATLRRPAQILDEMPMVLGSIAFLYCLLLPLGTESEVRLSLLLGSLGFVLAFVYVVIEAYVVFVVIYGGVVTILTLHSAKLCFSSQTANGPLLKLMWKWSASTFLFGFSLWVADHYACSRLGVGHLHILWHMFAVVGVSVFVKTLMALTADQEGFEVSLQRGLILIPALQINGPEDAATVKKGQ